MRPFNYVLRKCKQGYKFTLSQEKFNHLMYIDDINIFFKNEKELETLIDITVTFMFHTNIQSAYKN